MADNVNLGYEDLGDLDLDFDFDFGDNTGDKKKGKGGAIREFAAGLWTGAKQEFTAKGSPQRIIRSLLPTSFSPAFDAKDRAARFKDDLYDKVKTNTRDSVNDLKDITVDALSMYGGKLPEKVLKNIEVWANSKSIDYSVSTTNKDDGPQLDVDASTDDLLAALQQSTVQSSQLATALHKEAMAQNAAIATRQSRTDVDTLGFLQGIHRLTARQVGFTEQFTANYQRKSLELQYRSYKLQMSIGKMQERYYKRQLEGMASLVKNTGLTDFEKMSHGASARELVRKRALGALGGNFSQFGNRLFDNVFNVVDQRSQDVNHRASGGLAAARMAMMGAQQARMMGRSLGAREYGQMAGQGLASSLPWLLSTFARPALARNDKLNRMGHDLSYYANAAPGLANGWLRNRQNFSEDYNPNDPNNKWYTRLQKRVVNPFVNNTLFQMPASMGNRTRLNNPGVKDLTTPAIFDQMTRRSIVEVIPGLLTRQLTQVTAIANKMGADVTGVQEVNFNHIQGGFTSKKRANVDLRSSIFNRNEFASAASSFSTMVDSLDPDKELSPNARVALAMRFARDAEAGDGFNVNSYLKSSGWGDANKDAVREINEFLHKRFDTREATGKAKAFGQYQIGDAPELAQLRNNMSNIMQAQSQYMPNVEESLNTMANSGSRAQLKDMGVIKRVNGQDVFNHDMYWEMMRKFLENPNYRPDREGDEKGSDVDPAAELGGMGREALDNLRRGVTDQFGNLRGRLTREQEAEIREQLSDARANSPQAYEVVRRQLAARYGEVGVNRVIRRMDNSAGQGLRDRINGFADGGTGSGVFNNIVKSAGDLGSAAYSKLGGMSSPDLSAIKQSLMSAASQGKEAISSTIAELQSRFGKKAVDQAVSTMVKEAEALSASTPQSTSSVFRQTDSNVEQRNYTPTPAEEQRTSEAATIVQAQMDNNNLLREVIGVMASVRDATTATKDATLAQVTGDPSVLREGMSERQGWLRGLGKRMSDSRAGHMGSFAKTVFKHLPNINSPVLTIAKWATLGPAYLGFKATKGLWNMLRDKKRSDQGDTDGDGVRENSVRDILRKRAQRKKEQEEAKNQHGDKEKKEKPTTLFGLVAGLFSSVSSLVGGIKEFGILGGLANFLKLGWVGTLVGGLGKLIMGKKAVDAATDVLDDLGDAPDTERGRRGRRTRGRAPKRGILNRTARFLGRNTAKGITKLGSGIASRTVGMLRGGPGGFASKLLKGGGIVAAGVAGLEAYDSYKAGDNAGVAEAVGSGAGGILGGAAMGAAIGSVIPVVGTLAGGIIGGALGAMGGGAIGRSLYTWFNDPGLLQQMRLRQYGIPDNDSSHVAAILKLEAALEPFVKTTDDGYASLDPKAPISQLASLFVDDPNDHEKVEQFAGWFLHRFKPVYLTHKAVAKQVLPSQAFMDLDKSTDAAAKYEIAKRAQQFDDSSDHPYRFTGHIFSDLDATDYKQTVALVQDVVDQLRKKAERMTTGTKSNSVFATGMREPAMRKEVSNDLIKAINPNNENLPGLNTVGHKESSWLTGDRTVVNVGDLLAGLLPKPGQAMDDLTALRMKVYGLPSLDIDKVSTLLELELVMANKVKFTDKGATFDGKASDIFQVVAPSFGLSASNQWQFKRWEPWFTNRFLPAYLAFAGTAYTQTGETRPTLAIKKMPPELQLAIANAMVNQKYYSDGVNAISIWTIKTSPWSIGELNDDASVVQNHLNNLKAQVKQAQYSAEPVKNGLKQSKDGTTDKDWRKDSSGDMVNNQVKTSTGQVYTSQRQQTTYNPETGRIETAYGGQAGGLGAQGGAGGIDNTGKVGPLKLGPGAEEGARILIRNAMAAGITDKQEIAMLLAQTHLESGGFSKLEENLRYKAESLMKTWPNRFPNLQMAQQLAAAGPVAIANAIYGGRMGNDKPGDGWKYRGRGFIQLTGKSNYAAASKALGIDLVGDPDRVASDSDVAAKTALWYWKSRKGLEDAAKKGDLGTVTKMINGGTHGLAERGQLFKQYTDMVGSGKFDDILSGKDTSSGAQSESSGDSTAAALASGQSQSGPANPALSGAKTAAELTAPGASAANAAAAGTGDAPALRSTSGPSAVAAVTAGSTTPNTQDTTASAIDNQTSTAPPPGAKTTPTLNTPPQMQPQQPQVSNAPQVTTSTPVAAPAPVMPKATQEHLSDSKDHLASIDQQISGLVQVMTKFAEIVANNMSKPGPTPQQPASGAGAPAVGFKRGYGNG